MKWQQLKAARYIGKMSRWLCGGVGLRGSMLGGGSFDVASPQNLFKSPALTGGVSFARKMVM